METITSSLGTRRKYEHIYSATLKNTAHNLHVLHWSGLEAIATLNQYVCHNMWCDTTVPRLNTFLHNKNTHLWSQCCPLQKNLFETPYSRQYTCVNVYGFSWSALSKTWQFVPRFCLNHVYIKYPYLQQHHDFWEEKMSYGTKSGEEGGHVIDSDFCCSRYFHHTLSSRSHNVSV